ncbi:hypothetical protein ACQ4PT_055676 [Festuca glaucescens]
METRADGPLDDDDPFGLNDLIDDMSYRVWKCGRCLSMKHSRENCNNDVRCRSCFRYGHMRKDCFGERNKKIWVPKQKICEDRNHVSSVNPNLEELVVPSSGPNTSSDPSSPVPSPATLPFPSRLLQPSAMANFAMDPARWVPLGQQIIDGEPTRLPRTFYNLSVQPQRRNDNVITAILMPPPPKQLEPSWRNQDDEVLERTLVYVTFTSPALVPRDIVFRNYANLGNAKESWTAPCYILTAGFADIFPADEDQMPPDGNPHPLPGNLLIDHNNFVLPQFLELGWDDLPMHQPQVHEHDFFQPEPMKQQQEQQVMQEEPEEDQVDSSIINASSNSDNLALGDEGVNQNIIINSVFIQWSKPEVHYTHLGMDIIDDYRTKLASRVCGPVLPPKMQCDRFLSKILPAFATSVTPLGFPIMPKFQFIVRDNNCWKDLFSSQNQFIIVATNAIFPVVPTQHLEPRQVACRLQFGEQDEPFLYPIFTATPDPATSKRKRGVKKQATPLVDTSVRQSTRSCTKKNGHRYVILPDPRGQVSKKRKIQRKMI